MFTLSMCVSILDGFSHGATRTISTVWRWHHCWYLWGQLSQADQQVQLTHPVWWKLQQSRVWRDKSSLICECYRARRIVCSTSTFNSYLWKLRNAALLAGYYRRTNLYGSTWSTANWPRLHRKPRGSYQWYCPSNCQSDRWVGYYWYRWSPTRTLLDWTTSWEYCVRRTRTRSVDRPSVSSSVCDMYNDGDRMWYDSSDVYHLLTEWHSHIV